MGLAQVVPAGPVLVTESGIFSGADVAKLKSAGFNAFLIGEHFMRAPDPGLALEQVLADARTAQGHAQTADISD
jgi:indole-3-glycerol phosphate synthase